ncbi:uncharacterized protein BO96DRAFT_437167 [Aspergillus niger CBS 101883]|uniref:Uncharacterized protein n=2 Tax=Aspergillus niger TaxID=5061 RepID=A2R0P5_ASPNC|nr:uncharacterized protein BO96DRAFT_437167 [Aspergillus niger CBS 101883]XP_059601966.1 hypothetical protein An12g09320 [Aspergillus niger]PYH53204.1 hypothetical protein BO96DRAFT_437167 [Aspergillus niger CBS 101883]CAK41362.1 hypothetical protein An12g09320 [Aspergillus niger]
MRSSKSEYDDFDVPITTNILEPWLLYAMLPFDDANAVSHLVGKGESSPINTTIDMLLYILFVLYAHRTVVSPIDWLEATAPPPGCDLGTGSVYGPGYTPRLSLSSPVKPEQTDCLNERSTITLCISFRALSTLPQLANLPLRLRDHSRLMKKTFINAATLSIAGTAAIAPGWVAVTADVDDEMMGVKPSWKLPMLRLSLTTLKLFLVPERKIDIEQELKRHHCLKLRRTSMTDLAICLIGYRRVSISAFAVRDVTDDEFILLLFAVHATCCTFLGHRHQPNTGVCVGGPLLGDIKKLSGQYDPQSDPTVAINALVRGSGSQSWGSECEQRTNYRTALIACHGSVTI